MKRLLSKDSSSKYLDSVEPLKEDAVKSTFDRKASEKSLLESSASKSGLAHTESLIKFLDNKGDIDWKSRNSLDHIKKLFGDSHSESRDMLTQLELKFYKDHISVTDKEAIKLMKQPKKLSTLNQGKVKVD